MLEGIVIWGILWFVGAWGGAWLIVGLFVFLADAVDAFGLIIVGWVLGFGWWVFAIIQVALHIIHLVEYFVA